MMLLALLLACADPPSAELCRECVEAAREEAERYRECGIELSEQELVERCATLGIEMYRCHIACLPRERCPKDTYSNYFYDGGCEAECKEAHWVRPEE